MRRTPPQKDDAQPDLSALRLRRGRTSAMSFDNREQSVGSTARTLSTYASSAVDMLGEIANTPSNRPPPSPTATAKSAAPGAILGLR